MSDEPNFTDEEVDEIIKEIERKDVEVETIKKERHSIIERLIDKAESVQTIARELSSIGDIMAANRHWEEADIWLDAASEVDPVQFSSHPRLRYVQRFRP